MSDKKQLEDCPSEEASSQAESYDANKSGTSETYDMKDFCPGIRIEAKDFDGKWYPAKVSDVDWTENEILVHFENWNTKFDEWIPMDSSRLRSLQKPVHQTKEHVKFAKGEEVMAMWSPYQKYPATIQAVLANDRYDVLFYDGFLKRLKSHKISKLEGQTVKTEVKNFADIGTKEERRERKRKINVAELFHINKRSRKKGLVHSKPQDIKTYPVTKSKNKTAVVKKPFISNENSERVSNVDSNISKPKDDKIPSSGTTGATKALIDTIPAAFEVKYINGHTEMWSKQLYQRSEGRTAGKLDIVILNPQGRKFRSRNEIMKYCEENGIIYSHESFDFSAKGRPKSKSSLQISQTKIEATTDDKDKSSLKKNQRKSQLETPIVTQPPIPAIHPMEMLPPDSNGENKLFIGEYEVAIENGKLICPVKICAKHFRRENLLHMHMKHYHPEFSKYLDYTPSVTDLAYARTVGGLDATEISSPTPRKISEKTEKPSGKIDNVRKSSDTSVEYVKEAKRIKLDARIDGKAYPTKGLGEVPAVSPDVTENSTDESQKNKITLNALLNAKSTSASNENDPSATERKGIILDNKIEQVASDSKSTVSHNVMKSLRHRLNGRKKNGRFQGSFVEHMRKKRLIGHDHSRSQNRMGRHQQSQHLRQQLQQSVPLQTAVTSQSCLEDLSSNNSSQVHSLPRYPNITNEISGKNNLLTSTKTIPRKGKHSFESDDNNSSGENEEENEKKMFTGANQPRKLVNTIKPYNKRRFLAGLINARKRSQSSYRIRRKKKKRPLKMESESEFAWEGSLGCAGLRQETCKPIKVPENVVLSEDCQTNETKEMPKENASHHGRESSCENTDAKAVCNKRIKIRLKRIDGDTMKLVEGNSEDETNSEGNELRKILPKNNSLTNQNLLSDGPPPLKTENLSANTDENDAPNDVLVNRANANPNVNGRIEEEGQSSIGFTENEGESKESKNDVDPKDLPKSYVLLENVCRKEIFNKYYNACRRGNDENVGARKGKKNKRSNLSEESNRRPKRVRFENTITEKWISPKNEGDEVDESKLRRDEAKAKAKAKETRRADRKRKMTKGGQIVDCLMIGGEVSQGKWSDDISRAEKTLDQNNSGLDQVEGTEDSKSALVLENSKVEKLRRNEIINCLCGITEEDGLMIQCDLCLCWQHGHCSGIFRESDVPDKYTCAICKNPYRARSSMKYLHDQEWLKEGSLPSLSFRSKREEVITQRRTILKRSYDLSGSIALLARVIHSLRLKVNIAEKKDHPKLWLWAKKWTEKKPNRLKEDSEVKDEKTEQSAVVNNEVKKEEGVTEDEKQLPKAPEPEAPIDSAECKLNLLDHLIHYQSLIDARLSCIESLVAELESMQDDAVNDEAPDRYPRTKATVQMLLRDLNTMKKIAVI